MQRQNFELLILGTSSAAPTTKRNPSAQLLNVAERFFLIDCGEGTQIQLRKYKTKFQKIDHIFISHLHGDHFLGLPGLLASMHLLGRKQEINIYCPKELKEIIDKLNSVSETKMNYDIKWHFTKNDKINSLFEDEKVEVHSFPMKHRIFCTGFLFKEKPLLRKIDKFKLDKNKVSTADINNLRKGEDVVNADGKKVKNKEVTIDPELARSFAYCSDTIYDENLVKYIKDVDLLYHESTFLNDKAKRAEETFHSTAEQAAKIAKAAKVKQLILGHYSARYGDLTPFIDEASPYFKNVMLATEGKKFKI
ncbi:MAG TPA: ribonuclease Z [Bacteroidia bacterium]|jgi:ribonuclease Z|nr:ribonuclease Z [Bacteroidia bacterium]